MARGYPDWFGLPVFPSYGPIKSASGVKVVAASTQTTILEINAKAVTVTGLFYAAIDHPFSSQTIYITVDGLLITQSNLNGLFDPTVLTVSPGIIKAAYASRETDIFRAVIIEGVTFGEQLLIEYLHTKAGNTANVYANVLYQEVK